MSFRLVLRTHTEPGVECDQPLGRRERRVDVRFLDPGLLDNVHHDVDMKKADAYKYRFVLPRT
jgi:hypothetical protein